MTKKQLCWLSWKQSTHLQIDKYFLHTMTKHKCCYFSSITTPEQNSWHIADIFTLHCRKNQVRILIMSVIVKQLSIDESYFLESNLGSQLRWRISLSLIFLCFLYGWTNHCLRITLSFSRRLIDYFIDLIWFKFCYKCNYKLNTKSSNATRLYYL